MTTISTHTKTAVILGTPDTPLRVVGGQVTLDAGSAPHVTAQLTIRTPSQATLDLLDARTSPPPRVKISVTATFPDSTQTRDFTLTLRSRPVRLRDGRTTLELSSREALIGDYAPLADVNLLSFVSLSAMVAEVIRQATGETVAVGGTTADITPLWDATNFLLNPGLDTDTSNWGAGTGASGLASIAVGGGALTAKGLRWTAAAGDSDVYPHASITQTRATPGKMHRFGVRLQSPTPRQARITMRFYDTASGLLSETSSPYAVTSSGGWTEYQVAAIAPSQAAYVFCFIHTIGNTSGQFHFAHAPILVVSDFWPGFFYGGTPDTAHYDYAWTGTAGASTSTRRKLVDAPEPDALVWDAGQDGLTFLAPLVQAKGKRLVCDETGAWTLRDESYLADGALSHRYAVNLIDSEDTISRADREWFDAAVTVYKWDDIYGVTQQRVDSYGIAGYSRARLFEKATAYPGPGFSEYAVRRAKGRGRVVTSTTVSDWRTKAEQPAVIYLDGAPIQTGKTDKVTFDLDTDEMTVTTRTTDTPASAWVLIPADSKWNDQPAGGSWTGEVI